MTLITMISGTPASVNIINIKAEQSGTVSDDSYEELSPLDVDYEPAKINFPSLKSMQTSSKVASPRKRKPTGDRKSKKSKNDKNRPWQSKCDFCQKCFRDMWSIKKHMIVHGFIEDKENRFNETNVTTAYNKSYVNESSKICYICSKFFSSPAEMKVHLRDNHDVCDLCNVRQPSCMALKQHIKDHFKYSLKKCKYGFHIRCPYCTLNFINKADCSRHMSSHYTKEQFGCRHCSQKFKDRGLLLEHLLAHSGTKCVDTCSNNEHESDMRKPKNTKYVNKCSNNERACDVCRAKNAECVYICSDNERACAICKANNAERVNKCSDYERACDVSSHMCKEKNAECINKCSNNEHACDVSSHMCKAKNAECVNKRFDNERASGFAQCDICKVEFSAESISSHIECHKKVVWCHFCGETFDEVYKLTRHIDYRHNKDKFKCEICQKSFSTLSHIRKHMTMHQERIIYQCKHCSKSYLKKQSLKYHEIEKHSNVNDSEKFSCEICDQKFVTKFCLTQHVISHKRKPIFKCNFCPQTFFSYASARIHEGSKHNQYTYTYTCNMCDKTFSSSSSLNAHKVVHSNIRSHNCKVCGKSFKNANHLFYHMHIHTGERPYVCDICGRGFTNQTHRKTHMRIHTGETPFTCSHCDAAYPTKAQLQRHVFKHE